MRGKHVKDYELTISIKTKAENDEQANEKFCSMLIQLELLLGYTTEKKIDSLVKKDSVLNFSIKENTKGNN